MVYHSGDFLIPEFSVGMFGFFDPAYLLVALFYGPESLFQRGCQENNT